MSTICLSMIVKDESHIIMECLESVAPHIDYWCICDTGSTDDTKKIITDFFEEKGIPGELHDKEWVNFSHNRTEAIDICNGKTDYIFMIDADDRVVGDLKWPADMNQEGYEVKLKRGNLEWWRIQTFKNDGSWMYEGVLHEFPRLKENRAPQLQKLFGDWSVEARTLGARNVGQTPVEKYTKDAIMLEEAIIEEPNNSRYQFYLAQSYFDSHQYEKAIESYKKRAEMGGWEEETYFSLYRIGLCNMLLDKPMETVIMAMTNAWNFRPIRAESLHELSRYLRMKEQPRLAYLYAKMASGIKFPEWDILFVNKDVYDFMVLDELSATAFYVHEFDEGLRYTRKLLSLKLPDGYKERLRINLEQYEAANKQHKEKMTLMNQKRQQEKSLSVQQSKPRNFKKRKKVKR
ncbi:MAG: glycosyltransferase [Proteobacteria bacterium]|nr:glycosyltransferase [Pseudomonadota bacterium]